MMLGGQVSGGMMYGFDEGILKQKVLCGFLEFPIPL